MHIFEHLTINRHKASIFVVFYSALNITILEKATTK